MEPQATAKTLEDFKRHYHKVFHVYSQLEGKELSRLRIKMSEGRLTAEASVENEELATQLVVLMRRFLCPDDSLYFEHIWKCLRDDYGTHIPKDVMAHTDSLIERMATGDLVLQINGERQTAEQIYAAYSEGVFFSSSAEGLHYLLRLGPQPIIEPVVLDVFLQYSIWGFFVATALFEALKSAKRGALATLEGSSASLSNQCIYCLTTKGSFKSTEHIFSESLGNDELILPRGYVCDRCNHGILSLLDDALIKFEPIALTRVLFVPHDKRGRLPEANFQNLHLRKTSPRRLQVAAKDRTGELRKMEDLGSGWSHFAQEIRGRVFDPCLLGRALYKIALGTVAFEDGQERACSGRYDDARAFVCDGHDITNNLLMRSVVTPRPRVQVSHSFPDEGTPFLIDIFGLAFLLNLENSPVLSLSDDLSAAGVVQYSLSECSDR